MTTTERPERASVMAAAAPTGPPPRTTTSHSGQTMWWSKEAFIFDILHFVRNGLRDDKTELRPLLDHVYVLPTFRHPLSIVLLTAPHLIRTLAGHQSAPVSMLQSLKSACHGTAILVVSVPGGSCALMRNRRC